MNASLQSPAHRPRRPGSVYVFILGIAVLLTVIGLSVVSLARLNTRLGAQADDVAQAEVLAESAAEYGLFTLAENTNWRTAYSSGVETAPVSLGAGTFAFRLVDEGDGNLADDPQERVRLYGIGRAGAAVRIYSVELKTKGLPLDVLRCAAHAAKNVVLNSNVTAAGGPLSSNAGFTVPYGKVVYGSVEAVVVANGGTITGTVTSGAPLKPMPSSDVYDAYLARATQISYWSLNDGRIKDTLLSPGRNPYGGTNAEGIYYISVPIGKTLKIEKSRIFGTLVVRLDTGARLQTADAWQWEPPSPSQPALVLKATGSAIVDLNGNTSTLSEANIGVNLNPADAPYNGASDSDLLDSYPCEMRGVAHLIGIFYTTDINSDFVSRGSIICEGPMLLGGNSVFNADPGLLSNPPEGYFTPGSMVPVAGTWRWEKAS